MVPHHDIGLFPITHMFHVILRQFKKDHIVQLFATGKIKGNMYVPFFGIMPIAKIVEDPSKKLSIGIGIRISVLEAEYGVISLAQDIARPAHCSYKVSLLSFLIFGVDGFYLDLYHLPAKDRVLTS